MYKYFNVYLVALVLVILNGINTGIFSFFKKNMLQMILGYDYARYFYNVIGLVSIYLAYILFRKTFL